LVIASVPAGAAGAAFTMMFTLLLVVVQITPVTVVYCLR
jgi:hypothetical protein